MPASVSGMIGLRFTVSPCALPALILSPCHPSPLSPAPSPMPRRTKLGILTLLLLLLAGVLKLFESTSPLAMEGWGACLRVGLILGSFWLAYPDLSRLPIWAYPAIGLL